MPSHYKQYIILENILRCFQRVENIQFRPVIPEKENKGDKSQNHLDFLPEIPGLWPTEEPKQNPEAFLSSENKAGVQGN